MDSTIEKVNLAQWILSLSDDFVIKKVSKSISEIRAEIESKETHPVFSTYRSIEAKKFDFEELKQTQNITPFEDGELNALIVEADIQESIEELLESID